MQTEHAAQPTPALLRAQPLRVSMLIQSYYPRIGGAEANLQALIPVFRRQGVEVEVLTRRYPGMPAGDVVAGAPVHRVPVPGSRVVASLSFTLSCLLYLARRRRSLDLVHAHELLSPTTTAALAKILLRRPIVAHVLRGGLLGDIAVLKAGRLGSFRLRMFTRLVDAFIAVSLETRDELKAIGLPESRIAYVPYGVDTQRFCPPDPVRRETLRTELGLQGRRVAVFVGRLVPEKGLDCLLDAWPGVRRVLPDALLVIAGEGTQRDALEARQVPEVRFAGLVRDPVPFLQAADCYVLPSYTEGLPNALLEAMSVGLPCVATTIGGSSEAIRDGLEGRLVHPGDPAALAEALIHALSGPERERLGAAARDRIIGNYSLERNAERLIALYARLTAKGAGE